MSDSSQMDLSQKPNRLYQMIAYSFAFLALGLTTGSLGPALPTLAEQTSVSLSTVGFLFTARSLGFMLGSFQGGRLLDRVCGHRMTAIALGVMSLMMFATPLSVWFLALLLVMLILGIAEAMMDVSCNTLLVWTHGKSVGAYMNGVHFFFGVGAFFAPIVIAWLSAFGHKSAFWLLALVIAPFGLLFLWLPSPKHKKEATGNKKISKANTKIVFLIALVFFLYIGAEIGFGGWIYTYAIKLKLSDETNAAYLTSVFWGALTVGRLLSIPLARYIRLEKLLLANLLGALLSLSLILLLHDSSNALWVGTIGLGFSLAAFFPTLFSYSERATNVTGKTAGKLLMGASAGGMTLPWFIGQVFEKISPRAAMFTVAFIAVFALFAFLILLRLVKNSKSETQTDDYDSLPEART